MKINYKDITHQVLEQANNQDYVKKFEKGLSTKLIHKISIDKNEPDWVLAIRLDALEKFHKMSMPKWGPSIEHLDFTNIRYFATATEESHATSWKNVDPVIKETFDRLKIPEAEHAILAGVGAQYESENIYHNLKNHWIDKGVLFEDFDTAIKKYPELVKKYFRKCIPVSDHKFAALHYAVFSGGTFLYIPKNVNVTEPLQSYFRMNAKNQGQFEHTLIIMEENSTAHYIEGCSAPKYGSQSLHAGAVEIFVEEDARFRYSSVENWSKDTFNLNTKRAIIKKKATMEWVSGNLGSEITMLYNCSILSGDEARANHLGIAFANQGQTQDTGAKIVINGKNCKANVISKSLSKSGGVSTYRGLLDIHKSADNALVHVQCDALMMDDESTSETIPIIKNQNNSAQITHEASTGKISAEVLLYFESRGISEKLAKGIIVNGFLDEVVKTLPLEYAMELNRLIELEMEQCIC